MKKKNGFTMVEVMVTVAIMGVLAGIVGITMGVLLGQRVKSMAADTKGVFQSTQIAAMGRDAAYIELRQDGNVAKVIAYASDNHEINRAEGRNISLSYSIGTGPMVPVTTPVKISFNRQTGGLDGTASSCVSAIGISNGNKTITLRISRLTGKVTY